MTDTLQLAVENLKKSEPELYAVAQIYGRNLDYSMRRNGLFGEEEKNKVLEKEENIILMKIKNDKEYFGELYEPNEFELNLLQKRFGNEWYIKINEFNLSKDVLYTEE